MNNQRVIERYEVYLGENTPFAQQSKEKERDSGHDSHLTTKWFMILKPIWARCFKFSAGIG